MDGTETSTVRGPGQMNIAENYFQNPHHVNISALDQLQMYGRHIGC